jgi:hypothetical protein
MSSELERLVAELRAVAAEVERLRPALTRHASSVRRYAAEVAAGADGRSGPRGQTASLLHQAARRCDALVAELANAKLAADHFTGRVLGGGSGGGGSGAGSVIAPAPSAAGPDDSDTKPPAGPGVTVKAGKDQQADGAKKPTAGKAGGSGDAEARGGGEPGAGAPGAAKPAPGSDPYVPWWIPNGAPWEGHSGISPRRDEDGNPPTRFSARDLTIPEAAGTEARGGHGGDHVPPQRLPVSDPSRDLVTAFIEAGYTSPNCLPKGLVEERCYWMDQSGHAALRHAEIPDRTLIHRLLLGRDPITGNTTDWETGHVHRYGRDATSFTSRSALAFAEAKAWSSAAGEQGRMAEGDNEPSFEVRLRARDIFGPDFRQHIKGWTLRGTKKEPAGVDPIEFDDETAILTIYRRVASRWCLYTSYPDRKKP